jgi:SHS2 domain-containing protein
MIRSAGCALCFVIRSAGCANGQRAGGRSGLMVGEGEMGFELRPHTADVMVRAWASTVEECLAEAARGLVSSFADVGDAGEASRRTVPVTCPPAPETELLVELLDEVVFTVDAHDVVPVELSVARAGDGGLAGEFVVVDRSEVRVIGPAPKAVTRHELRVEEDDGTWHCQVVIDV